MSGTAVRSLAGLALAAALGCLDQTPAGTTPSTDAGGPALVVPATAWLAPGGTIVLRLVSDSLTGSAVQARFETSDPGVATVSSGGQVTARAPGTAEIRLITRTGHAVSHVTVVANAPAPLVWRVAQAGLTDVSLLGIWSADTQTIFAVGQFGTVLRSVDGGTTWQLMRTPIRNDLVGVWGSSAGDVYAVGAGGAIMHYDGGRWESMPSHTTTALLEVWGLGPNDVYIVGAGIALRLEGAAWRTMPGAETSELWAVFGMSPKELYAAGQNGVLLQWDGVRWTAMQSPTALLLLGLWGTDRTNLYAAGIQGTVLKFDGSRWTPVVVPSRADFFAIYGRARNDILVVGNGGAVLQYDGVSWSFVPQTASIENLRAVHAAPGGPYRIAGWSGTIITRSATGWINQLTSTTLVATTTGSDGQAYAVGGGGAVMEQRAGRWVRSRTPTRQDLYGAAPAAAAQVIVVGAHGTILRGSGDHWTLEPSPVSTLLRSVWTDPADRAVGFIVGEAGAILTRSGGDWVTMTSPTSAFLRHVWGLNGQDVFAVGDSGTVLHYDGRSWQPMPSGIKDLLRGVWGTGPRDIFAVGANGGSIRFDGARWYRLETPTTNELRAVLGSGPTDVYAIGFDGTTIRFDGSSWTALPTVSSSFLLGLGPVTPGASVLRAVGTNLTILDATP